MGQQQVKDRLDTEELRSFSRRLLNDLRGLELMLERGMFETGIRRIGAEQEMFIVDETGNPAMLAMELLDKLDSSFTTELARFNLECNLEPKVFGGKCLSEVEKELVKCVADARRAAKKMGANVLLCGILPTIDKSHLGLDAITPNPRYMQLNNTLCRMRGGDFTAHIKGYDELHISHDNILFEACNTSFQVHFQVAPDEFARFYNLAQVVTAPVLAAAVNSPTLMQRRLWRETRIALFQQSIDNRSPQQSQRGHRPRVSFGTRWVKDSVVEIFREDIARYRILLATDEEEDPIACVERGVPPALSALRLHNGTVYRWNRPCYGIHEGKPHLRIENRVLPSGPTPVDEVANAAFFFGLMSALLDVHPDVSKVMAFDHAYENFISAAHDGLKAQFMWLDGKHHRASDLILETLLPVARTGLISKGIDPGDTDRYLGIIAKRVESGRTGADWALRSLKEMGGNANRDERYRALVVASLAQQAKNKPVHTWSLAQIDGSHDWRHSYRQVGQFMSTELFTVRAEDIIDFAASVMDWEHIRHVPVEDDDGRLVGLVTMRDMLKLLAKGARSDEDSVSNVMVPLDKLRVVTPETSTLEALRLMRDHKIGCLPVVKDELLVGLVTDVDLLGVATGWMEDQLASLSG